MIVGSVCMSHSPIMDKNRASPDTEKRFHAALNEARNFVAAAEPELTVVFYPDHVNGFFYDLLPSFCVGIEGQSIGDYGTAAGKLNIPQDRALDLVRHVMDRGVDTAISYRMEVDHGAMQPVELLADAYPLSRIIPIFINSAADPRPNFERVRAIGEAVGEWARAAPERVLVLGSGGLSHDPPVPALATATPEVRARLINGGDLSHEQRMIRQNRATTEGIAMRAGNSKLLPLDPAWDRMLLDAFLAGKLDVLDDTSDRSITETGGRGGHEVRTWVAALAAMGPGYAARELFYEPIDEWITGMGILSATAA
ncbi:2,3-dihydroxyphenylpropionate/2,3-dihydroxicinnam ic acid 1,2-dioxygenase [Sinisalibacter aestuarii]|uniref:2,3-dihydroxyphenylpropionate/2, 3-dihydroxicinnam ic acid 1,2-dioxygenase n=2 Tax=Sinisalibacter aestuarii TaxID=2949426 RepID=A0ABQ5LU19_9RHOB|nr:2,3-dihydroxyphenylpropionate/2,3-dihydroxicinnam ic acid 1,2-dioxygenase [Sinisalibacter aestuarii]